MQPNDFARPISSARSRFEQFHCAADVHDPGRLQDRVGHVAVCQPLVAAGAVEERPLAGAGDQNDRRGGRRCGFAHDGVEADARRSEIGQHGVAQGVPADHGRQPHVGAEFRQDRGRVCRASAAQKLQFLDRLRPGREPASRRPAARRCPQQACPIQTIDTLSPMKFSFRSSLFRHLAEAFRSLGGLRTTSVGIRRTLCTSLGRFPTASPAPLRRAGSGRPRACEKPPRSRGCAFRPPRASRRA